MFNVTAILFHDNCRRRLYSPMLWSVTPYIEAELLLMQELHERYFKRYSHLQTIAINVDMANTS